MRGIPIILAALLVLSACEIPSWLGSSHEIKRAPGDRYDVVLNPSHLKPEASAQDVLIEVPEQTNLAAWPNHNEAMKVPHIGLTGLSHEQTAKVGDGNGFSRGKVSPPIVAEGLVVVMDAAGIVSAHEEGDIDEVRWTNDTGTHEDVNDVLGGGLTYDTGVVYATTGYGNLRALDVKTGKPIWNISVGAPVRSAPAVGNGMVIVLTADNQTLAFDVSTGKPRWEHRGIRETAGYFSTTAAVISEDIVVAAYSSGEVFALRAETGSVLWTDTLSSAVKTRAAAVFSGIDADPIVQDGVVVVTTASGEMQASALANGRPLWQQKVGAHTTPWSAGNALFVLSETHDIAALLKRDGMIRWAESLSVADSNNPNRDKTPPLYGPILAGNAVLVIDGNGILSTFRPTDGKRLSTFELAPDIASAPIIVNGALYYVTRDAVLHRYY